jgi:hypothetical protein
MIVSAPLRIAIKKKHAQESDAKEAMGNLT